MRNQTIKIKFALSALGIAFAAINQPTSIAAEVTLPKAQPEFKGKIGATYKDSTPDYPQPLAAPKDAPNVLLIVTDDTGFGHAATFGGAANTATLDRLAANGLRYNRLHTTAMCSPSRAALMTGRNHHSVGSGVITPEEKGHGKPANAKLFVDGKETGAVRVEKTVPVGYGPEGLDIGADNISPVSPEYKSPFAFSGKIKGVTIAIEK